MAQTQHTAAGQKRGPGRPSKNAAQPAAKKQKLAQTTEEQSPSVPGSPAPQHLKTTLLPTRLSTTAPLPTVPQPQSPNLPEAEWQSIASSGVLAASFERSRQNWTQNGIFQRFWTKPPKVRDQDKALFQSMKSKGKCRLRIEPHIFEVEVWVVEKPVVRQPAQSLQKPQQLVGGKGGYGGQYGQLGYGQSHPQQSHVLPPIRQPLEGGQSPAGAQALPPIQIRQAHTPQAAPKPTPPAQEKKPSPDPVISMLANRASSDPELKGLMKEVATGNATPEQLKVFQKHIDELTAVIQARKAKEEEEERRRAARATAMPQYDGSADIPRQHPVHAPSQQPIYQQPKPYTPPPPPAPSEVVFAFTASGATEDRFLFPQHSILEPLSQQHVLASFIVTRFGRDIANYTAMNLEPETEYWQPVTMMVEVAYGREQILRFVSSWVKPAEEVREEMGKVMERCKRAPEGSLALRLPLKGAASAAESEQPSKAGTPVASAEEKKKAAKVKPAAQKRASGTKETLTGKGTDQLPPTAPTTAAAGAGDEPAAPTTLKDVQKAGTDGAVDAQDDAAEGARPRRTTRKSVRISEA